MQRGNSPQSSKVRMELYFAHVVQIKKFDFYCRLVIRGSQCLIDKELSVSKQSHKFLKTLSTIRTKNNQLFLFTEPLLSSLKEMAQNSNDSLQLRVLELMVEISNVSQEHLEK